MTDRQTRLKQMPTSFRKSYKKSLKSKAFAIKSFCAECTGYDRKAVRYCTDSGCPLWHHRPFQDKNYDDQDSGEEDDQPESPDRSPEELAPKKVRKKCCDSPDIEKDGLERHCKKCDKKWKKKGKQ